MRIESCPMTKIKICGITSLEDGLKCAEAGADALGFVFASSLRQVTPKKAAEICEKLPKAISKVGVFVNKTSSTLLKIAGACQLDYVQLQGGEDRDYLGQLTLPYLKVFRVKDQSILQEIADYRLSLFMLDTYSNGRLGGSGKSFDWEIAVQAKKFGRLILSGGLNPKNVRSALEKVRPYGVDVCSGVESMPGKKDIEKVKKFIQEVRRCDSLTD